MNVRRLFTDDSAVSPVIGVVLMVAITVLLAATAATFVLGIGQENTNSKPNAAIGFDYEQGTSSISGTEYRNDSLEISHDSGDSMRAKNLDVSVQDAKTFELSGGTVSSSALDGRYKWNEFDTSIDGDDEIAGGKSVTLKAKTKPVDGTNVEALTLEQTTVKVVWNDPESSSTFTLREWSN